MTAARTRIGRQIGCARPAPAPIMRRNPFIGRQNPARLASGGSFRSNYEYRRNTAQPDFYPFIPAGSRPIPGLTDLTEAFQSWLKGWSTLPMRALRNRK